MRAEPLLALVLFAGCLAHPAAGPAPPPTPHALHALDLSSCAVLSVTYPIDLDRAQRLLPAGYTANGYPAPEAWMEWARCSAAALDNATALHAVSLLVGSVGLAQRPHDSPGDDFYALELYASPPELARWLAERGFPTTAADLSLSDDGRAATLRAPNATYSLSVGPGTTASTTESEVRLRLHHASATETVWANVTRTPTALHADAAALGPVAGGAAGATTATPGLVAGPAALRSSRFLYVFDQETLP